MALIFTPCSGAVEIARPDCPSTQVLTITVDGVPLSLIVTGMTLEMSGNYQFLHTLNDFVYFYAFGDRVGSLSLTGLGFIQPCQASSKGTILQAYDYYLRKRSATSGNKALNLVLTGAGSALKLWGFLTGMRIDVTDSQMGVVGYWTMRFEVLPQK